MKRPPILNSKFDPDRFLKFVTLRQIRYFVAAAEAGKITLAAAMIAISPSAISEAINELEEYSGVPLFLRQPRGLSLTHEGRNFLSYCRRILSTIREATYGFDRSNSEVEGHVRLALSSTVAGYFIPPILLRFQRAFPNISLQLFEADRHAIVSGLLEDRFDLSVAIVSNIPTHTALRRQILVRSTRRLWLPPEHPLLQHGIVTLDDIATQPYVQLTVDGAEISTSDYWQAVGRQPNVIFRTESLEAVRSLIALGQGVTILSDMMYRPWSLEGDRVEVQDIAEQIPTMDIGVLWKGDGIANEAAQAFQAFCRIESIPIAVS